jgi:hypothetical protein
MDYSAWMSAGRHCLQLGFVLALVAVARGQSRPLDVTYDRATNQTLFTASSPIHLQPSVEDRIPECGLRHPEELHRFQATYRCSGDVSGCSNGNLVLNFSFCTSAWRFNTVQVAIAIGGAQIALPPSLHPNRVLSGSVLDDAVSVECPVAALRGLSIDSKVEVTLGAYSYQLSGGNLDSLRTLAERIR